MKHFDTSVFCALLLAFCMPVVAQSGARVACPDAASGGADLTRAPYSARRDGSADVGAAFIAALADPKVRVVCLPPGEYRIDEQVLMRTGQDIGLLGLSADPEATRIVWKAGVTPFFSSPTRGPETRIRRFTARNITFDGKGLDGRALNLLATTGPGADTFFELDNVVVRNMTNLPIWVEGFSRVRIAHTKFQRTKDPGILRSNNIEIVDNEVTDSSDNCLSVSRGNSKVVVARNRLHNCKSAGIFVGGIFYDGRAKRTFQLDVAPGKPPGTECVLRSQGADHFRFGMIDTHLTLRRGEEFVIVKITGWDDKDLRAAPCQLVSTVPGSLAGKPTTEWSDGPHFGGGNAVIENNEISGSLGNGITLSLGVQDVVVRKNTVRDSGLFREDDGRELRRAAFGIVVLGWFLGSEAGAHRYAENIQLLDNEIVGAATGGIRLGSQTTGGVRRVVAKGNRITFNSPEAKVGVLVDWNAAMPSRDNEVVSNAVRFAAGGKSGIALRIDAPQAEACSALGHATVDEMTHGGCAMRVDKTCIAQAAPSALRCATRR